MSISAARSGAWWIALLAIAPGWAIAGELSGFVGSDLRYYPESSQFPDQDGYSVSPSLLLQPEFRQSWNEDGDRLTFVSFARLDANDDHRTHADVRELNWFHTGGSWDLRLGIGTVFWGVAESRHLVNIINQDDRVEDIDEEVKLGQPMVNLNLSRDWGNLSVFILPGFRERNFPDREARLRGGLFVDTDRAEFESAAEQWHVDYSARWSRTIGDWDIGVAHFWGTSREPRLIATPPQEPTIQIPRYDIIDQTSLDLQVTKGSWLWKLEAITRGGQGDRFAALVAGFEYTLYGLYETPADVGLLSEYLYDGRDSNPVEAPEAPVTIFDNDLFLGARFTLNDTQSTELLLGATVDLDTQASVFTIEGSRRLGDAWRVEIEGRLFANVPRSDVGLRGLEDDGYIQLRVARFF